MSEEIPAEIAIIGFGPAGQIASRPLIDMGVRVAVIDLNRVGIRKALEHGFRGELGDATQNDVLEHAGLHACNAVVITVPHHESAMSILEQVRKCAPHVHIIVRSRHQSDTADFVAAGAHAVAGDEEQVGESLAKHVSQWVETQSVASGASVTKSI